jgi:hypothetical protein
LNDTIDQKGLTEIYRIFHHGTERCTYFSAAHGTFCKIEHISGHRGSLKKYKKIEIILYILSDHNTIKLEVNNNKTAENT